MEFYCFHLMPWPYLPGDFMAKNPSAWVTYSNKNFDGSARHCWISFANVFQR